MVPYDTDAKLKDYLDSNQLSRERMCLAILSLDKRFKDVRPRHPRGGPDGGIDIEAVFEDSQIAHGAVGFVNQANDAPRQRKQIKTMFEDDLRKAAESENKPGVFLFFTNVNLSVSGKDSLIEKAKKQGINYCEIFDRERLRISLDNVDGLSVRYHYLGIPLSEAEQASFFSRWGNDIQSVISTGFQKVDDTLNRLLFLQEADNPIYYFTASFNLDKTYPAEEIDHFRAFCFLHPMKFVFEIESILFGKTDKAHRIGGNVPVNYILSLPKGIKNGISGGQWENYRSDECNANNSDVENEYVPISFSSAVGMDEVSSISFSYGTNDIYREPPFLLLKDVDEAEYVFCANESLARKIKTISIYSNGYKLKDSPSSDLEILLLKNIPEIPVFFSDDELNDPWVCIRPKKSSSFTFDFFSETPKRVYTPTTVKNNEAWK